MHGQDCGCIVHQQTNEVICQHSDSDFAIEILWGLATQFAQAHRCFAGANIDFHIPTQAVQFRNLAGGKTVCVQQRRNDSDLLATPNDAVADHAVHNGQRQRLPLPASETISVEYWSFQRNEFIFNRLARAFKRGISACVDAANHFHATFVEQRRIVKRFEVAIGNHDVAFLKISVFLPEK